MKLNVLIPGPNCLSAQLLLKSIKLKARNALQVFIYAVTRAFHTINSKKFLLENNRLF